MLSSAKTTGMRSYPRALSRTLLETLSRAPTGGRTLNSSSLSFRSPASTANPVVVASALRAEASSVQGALRAAVPRQRSQGGGEGDGFLQRKGGLCAAAVAAAVLAADENIENKQVR